MRNHLEIFWQFLLLGLVSFGGPMAHIGYFRKTFVEKLRWLDDEAYTKLVALSQFLPGPSSSQVGFSIGLMRGGLLGGFLASLAFTLPSFLLLYFLATLHIEEIDNKVVFGVISGLKLFALIVVADACLSMFKSFCNSRLTVFIFILSTLILLTFQSFLLQIFVILLGGTIGAIFAKSPFKTEPKQYARPNIAALVLFLGVLIFTFLLHSESKLLTLFASFYQIGSLVFGGGHVILPLIAQSVPVDDSSFLVGYALAQAVPGPMFTIASYLGAVSVTSSPFLGAFAATLGIFLPGFLLIVIFRESFESYSKKPLVAKALIGVNATVVALIFAALLSPILPSAVDSIFDIVFAIIGFIVMRRYKIHIFYFICFYSMLGALSSYL